MESSLEELVASVQRDDEGATARLTAALASAEFAALAELGRHPSSDVRASVAAALTSRSESGAREVALALAKDEAVVVSFALAQALAQSPTWAADDLYATLLNSSAEVVRLAILAPASQRAALHDELLIALVEDASESVRVRLSALIAELEPERALPMLVENLAADSEAIQRAAARALSAIVSRFAGFPPVTALPSRAVVATAVTNLRAIGRRKFARLLRELELRMPAKTGAAQVGEAPTPPDVTLGEQRGANLTREAQQGRLERATGVEARVDALIEILSRPKSRAAVLLGESGVGKTAIVHELVHRLAHDPRGAWTVVRMSPSDFLVGTKYLGEWQTQLQQLIESLASSQRTLLYVPSVHELTQIGTTSKTDENVASMLAPHIESGAIAIVGESTPAEFAAGMGRNPALRRAWTTLEIAPGDARHTRAVLRAICDSADVEASDAVLERTMDYAAMFLASTAEPGRAAGLLRRVLAQHTVSTLALRDVFDELSRSTGLPLDLLDDDVALDLGALRAFFEARVMGQPEALDSVVDLVTLIKAGLTDPSKPLAVLLFVGPTGVGKTELARALAERIFGDPARLLRFDMSEFASYESYERLIGARTTSGLLTSAVREKPFSVVLLDEIEKAHVNVFDLCLQVFDAGRLTDGSGRTIDFRRSIVILTSNIGAALSTEARLGFAGTSPTVPQEADVLRALRNNFRPEFLNRVDRIVCFRPLALETAERIARRELAQVLRRGGIERRGLALDVDPALVALLLNQGYNHAFGARPLKRTIERLVLMPVARAIASGEAHHGAVLRLFAQGERVEVRIVQPEPAQAQLQTPRPAANLLRLRERCARLVERVDALEHDCKRLLARKSELVSASNERGFWDRRVRALRTLDELHRVDGVLARVARIGQRSRATAEHALRARDARAAAELEERIDELEHDERLTGLLVRSPDARDLDDAWVVLTRVKSQKGELAAVDKLARMYVEWARRHRFEVDLATDRVGGEPAEDSIAFAVRGPGAFGLLKGESGLHVVYVEAPGARWTKHAAREVVRIDVLDSAEDVELDARDIKSESRALADARGRLIARPTLEMQLLHRPTTTAVTVWTDRERAAALEIGSALLTALVAGRNAATASSREHILRRYELGPTPRVRDSRVETAPKLHRVLAGEIDALLGL